MNTIMLSINQNQNDGSSYDFYFPLHRAACSGEFWQPLPHIISSYLISMQTFYRFLSAHRVSSHFREASQFFSSFSLRQFEAESCICFCESNNLGVDFHPHLS